MDYADCRVRHVCRVKEASNFNTRGIHNNSRSSHQCSFCVSQNPTVLISLEACRHLAQETKNTCANYESGYHGALIGHLKTKSHMHPEDISLDKLVFILHYNTIVCDFFNLAILIHFTVVICSALLCMRLWSLNLKENQTLINVTCAKPNLNVSTASHCIACIALIVSSVISTRQTQPVVHQIQNPMGKKKGALTWPPFII